MVTMVFGAIDLWRMRFWRACRMGGRRLEEEGSADCRGLMVCVSDLVGEMAG